MVADVQVTGAQIAQFDAARTSDRLWKTPQQGAVTSVLFATSPLLGKCRLSKKIRYTPSWPIYRRRSRPAGYRPSSLRGGLAG